VRAGLAPIQCTHFDRFGIPAIFIDMSHLYMPIKGQLVTAIGVDGNKCIYPIMWGIHPVEFKKEWIIFLTHLRRAAGSIMHERNVFLVGDRLKGSLQAFMDVFGFDPIVPVEKPIEYHCTFNACQEEATFAFPVSVTPIMCQAHAFRGMAVVLEPAQPSDQDDEDDCEFDALV
jgi:hypothetical protein